MKYAVFTVCMPEYTVEEGIDKLVEWGYDGVEFRVRNQAGPADPPSYWSGNRCTVTEDELLDKAEALGKRVRDAGLEVVSLASYLKCDQPEEVDRLFRACNLMGCSMARVGVTGYDSSANYRELFDKSVEQYGEIEKLARKYGVKSLIETHHGVIVASASAAYRFVSNFDAKHVGIIHDAANMVHEGHENYKAGFEILGDYLAEVHVKNAGWEKTETGDHGQQLWGASWCELKKGVVDWALLFGALKEVGYDRWMSIEDFSSERTTEEKLTDALAYLKELEAA